MYQRVPVQQQQQSHLPFLPPNSSIISLAFCPGPALVPVPPNQDQPLLDSQEGTEKCVDGDGGDSRSEGKVSACPASGEDGKEGKVVARRRGNCRSRKSALSPHSLPTHSPLGPQKAPTTSLAESPPFPVMCLSPSHNTTAIPAYLAWSKDALGQC